MKNPTIYNVFRKVADKYEERTALIFKKKEHWYKLSFKKVSKLIDKISLNLLKFQIKDQKRVAILSENRPEWVMVDLSLNRLNAISVPLHITANEELLNFIFQDAQIKDVIISAEQLLKYGPILQKIKLNQIIVLDLLVDKEFFSQQKKIFKDKLKFFDFSIIAKDKEKALKKADEIFSKKALDSIASIIYTSGTSGQPKGVVLTNRNFLANVFNVKKVVPIVKTDRFYSFLPLSHVLERTAGSYVPILSGASIAYASNSKNLALELTEINPTILISVPKIFERIFENILNKIKSSPNLIKKGFFYFLRKKENDFLKKIGNILIFNRLKKKIFGSNLRFSVSGGASLNPKIVKFFQLMNVKIVEGYGLTETSPITHVNPLDKIKIGSVGRALTNLIIKIAKDKEILVKGSSVFKEYWNNEYLTKMAFDKEGFFKTGDLGFCDKNGYLTIIGRKKDIIVTSNGKNVAPLKIEGLINLIPQVAYSVVVGHKKKYLTALISLNQDSISSENFKSFELLIQKEIDRINKKLSYFEQIRKIKILKQPLTIENEELTPTYKVRRSIIEKKHRRLIQSMY